MKNGQLGSTLVPIVPNLTESTDKNRACVSTLAREREKVRKGCASLEYIKSNKKRPCLERGGRVFSLLVYLGAISDYCVLHPHQV